MANTHNGNSVSTANSGLHLPLHIAAVFFLFLLAPLDWKFWRQLFTTHWTRFQDLFQLTAYQPHFIAVPKWGIASFGNWVVALAIAVPLGLTWSYIDRNRVDSDARSANLYYWFRVLLRYRLAIAIIGYGVIKLFPLQFPDLTLSDLNTNYADFLPWKIYYLTNSAAAAHYRETLGLAEVIAGILLLWRRFAVAGAALAAAVLINIVLANFAYQIGEHVYATLLLLIAVVLLAHDAARLFNLLVLRRRAKADQYEPPITAPRLISTRLLLKSALVLFLAVYGIETGVSYSRNQWPYPESASIPNAAGLYNVSEFSVNGNTLPYSLIDPVRWQNVVFEKWNTISIRIDRPVTIDVANPDIAFQPDDKRDYELAGNGGRHFYTYTADPAGGTIHLQGKNDPGERFFFNLARPDDRTILLTGNDEKGNALRIVLEKIDKKYLLQEGRRKPLTLY
jgi:hypothetical protein